MATLPRNYNPNVTFFPRREKDIFGCTDSLQYIVYANSGSTPTPTLPSHFWENREYTWIIISAIFPNNVTSMTFNFYYYDPGTGKIFTDSVTTTKTSSSWPSSCMFTKKTSGYLTHIRLTGVVQTAADYTGNISISVKFSNNAEI